MVGQQLPQGCDYRGFMEVFGDSKINICPAVSAETVTTPSVTNLQTNGDGNPNTPYYIDAQATDSQGYPVSYLISWGDGQYTTSGTYSSGAQEQFGHTYSYDGAYTITVYAESQDGVWSQSCGTTSALIGGNFFGQWWAADFEPTSATIGHGQQVSYTVNTYPQSGVNVVSINSITFNWYVNNNLVSQTSGSSSSSLTYTFNSAGSDTVKCTISVDFVILVHIPGYGNFYYHEIDSITCTGSVTVT